MVDKIEKALQKLNQEERQTLKTVLCKLKSGDLENLDLKKLKGKENIFRVRKGKMRIIFCRRENSIEILSVERRSNTTY